MFISDRKMVNEVDDDGVSPLGMTYELQDSAAETG